MTNQQPKNLPQYYQGTPGEVKLAAFLKNNDLSKSNFDQIINTFRASEYLIANVVDHYVTEVHPHPPEGVFHLTRRREGNQIVLGLQSLALDDSPAPQALEFVDIPALNLVASTIKRICDENGLFYAGMRSYHNVYTHIFHSTRVHQHKTALKISVDKEYHDYVTQGKTKARQLDSPKAAAGTGFLYCDEYEYNR